MRFSSLSAAALAFILPYVSAQQIGTLQTEVHPQLTVQQCTANGCTSMTKPVVLDGNWRWVHNTGGSTNCYTGNLWDATLCPDNVSCAANCAMEGANYSGTYGITTSGSQLSINLKTVHAYGTNIGGRVYLMNDDDNYLKLNLLNKEFTFDVDVSALPCGTNGALYFVEMAQNGGKSATNLAGARYGTGYCDAQCPHDIKFINGAANVEGWKPSALDANAGTGRDGTCCNEMDIWEANSMGSAYTPHPCSVDGLYRCTGVACGDNATGDRYNGVCDKDGCDYSPRRVGNIGFYGPGKTVDTTKKMTVVTQFLTQGGTDAGDLIEIRRLYVQNGVVIQNPSTKYPGLTGGPYDSVTDNFCDAQKVLFGDNNQYKAKGSLKVMGDSLRRGHVLVMSLWDDYDARMLWLDSQYPLEKDPATPGVTRGDCPRTGGYPADVEANGANTKVTFSNVKWGTIGSTFSGSTTSPSPASSPSPVTSPSSSPVTSPSPSPVTSPTSGTCSSLYGQCGGIGWSGPTCCVAGSVCSSNGVYYSQCIPGSSSPSPASSPSPSPASSPSPSPASSPSPSPASSPSPSPASSPSPSPSGSCASKWGQCGGSGFTGPTCCVSGSTCTNVNPYYSQCL